MVDRTQEATKFSFVGPRAYQGRIERLAKWILKTGEYAPEGARKVTDSYVIRLAVERGFSQLEREMET